MSWSITQQFDRRELMTGERDIASSLMRAFLDRQTLGGGEGEEQITNKAGIEYQLDNGTSWEAFGQVNLAVQTAMNLINGLGNSWGVINVSLSGHANPGHEKTPGWAGDSLHVSVSVNKYIADLLAEEEAAAEVAAENDEAPRLEVVGSNDDGK